MYAGPEGIRFSASDLSDFVECEAAAWLEGQRARGLVAAPEASADPMLDLLVRRGHEHEAAYLAGLESKGVAVTRIAHRPDRPSEALEATRAAMQAGAPAIYQAVLKQGEWFGIADFLEKVERPSALGAWSYEVLDTKLGRHTKPHYLLQLSLYSDLVRDLQGVAPERMHVILAQPAGRQSFECRDYAAYVRVLRARLATSIALGQGDAPYPVPVEHCAVCRWAAACDARWLADDHLSGVANIRRTQVVRLEAAGVRTIAALARLPEDERVPRIPGETLKALRQQARLQVQHREGGEACFELLAPAAGRGFALLPAPSKGDVFFDMEGDPYAPGGLEYLFGAEFADPAGAWGYKAWWGHSQEEEKQAFEEFIDFMTARRAADPAMHVYHYAAYEPTALKRLAGRNGTREAELDELLRGQVLVDLYRVVRQGLRASYSSYSIKDIEHFYMGARTAQVKDAGSSIVTYEHWIESHDDALLTEIARYNAEDCSSTRLLRDWLLVRAVEARAQYGEPPALVPLAPSDDDAAEERREEKQRLLEESRALVENLTAGLAGDPEALTGEGRARWLLAQLLDYHQREGRPAWWAFFDRMQMLPEELLDDAESIGGLEHEPGAPPRQDKRSLVHALQFPAQEFKLRAGDDVLDAGNGQSAGKLVEVSVDGREGHLLLKRGPSLAGVPLPGALIPGGPYNTAVQRAALRRLATSAVATGMTGEGPYRALRDLLRGAAPRVAGLAEGSRLQGAHLDLETAWPIVVDLAESALFVQGPPGAGKTWLGARLIVRLMREGKTVGVTALSHRAIHNLLHEIEAVAAAEGFVFGGLKKCSGDGGGDDESAFHSKLATPRIRTIKNNPEGMPAGVSLIAGTAWMFSRPELDRALDYLFIDEAGQIALADALAVGTSARNLVLLGDPQQLPQVSQATHPRGAGASVLEHVLGEHDTIPPERGLFLEQTWRMHPTVCAFISELAYEQRLVSAPGRENQRVDSPGLSGTGLRYLPVAHAGNSQRSTEEAEVIAGEIGRLLDGTFTDAEGETTPLTLTDILVVTPYNAQVQALLAKLPPGAQVGTVDKFQGREAAVVFFSMATSSGDNLPRDLEFLFSRNRLNVAISRARALAVLVASPKLLQVRCRRAAEMRLVNGVARFVEMQGETPLDAP